jgi:hypothetical protein
MRRSLIVLLPFAVTAACSSGSTAPTPTGFLAGTTADRNIVTTVLSLNGSLLQLQAGAPATRATIALGSSAQVTPVGFAIRGTQAVIPLGNAASAAVADLEAGTVRRVFTFPSGNATGAAWLDDNTFFAANTTSGMVGRVRVTQASVEIGDTVRVTASPTDVVVSGGRVFVVSSNLDENFSPAGNGVVTELNPTTLAVVRTFTVGRNPQYAAAGPDGRLYVTNSGDFFGNNGTLSIINLQTNTVEAPIPGFGDFPGPISITADGRALISGFGIGTIVWNTQTRTFIRGPANPLCAPAGSTCRGATGAQLAANGRIYQPFFGTSQQPARIFIYDGTSYALTDSIDVPVGASGVDVRSYF